jgi:hypothetical protein
MAGAVLLTAPPPPDARLAAALAPLLRQNPGRLAAAITDPATGFTATYHSDMALTTTTVTGQLRLLTDLTSARSPLSAPARHYELTLMSNVDPGQDWGVTAAASPGTRPAVKNGWLPAGPQGTWVIDSIGVISHAGHQLAIVILSDGQPSQPAGISYVQAATWAAITAAATTSPRFQAAEKTWSQQTGFGRARR